MNYADYGLNDFLDDNDFKKWVYTPTAESDFFWKAFLLTYPEKSEVLENARLVLIMLSADMESLLPDNKQVAGMWENIQGNFERTSNPVRSIWPLVSILTGAAAMIILVGSWLIQPSETRAAISYKELTSSARNQLVETKNTTSKSLTINLPDKSQIILQPKSSISYPKDFNAQKEREIYLSGEAFFSVTKNKERPFLVYSNELITKVLGTSFTIKAFEDAQQVEVEVKTGKVTVFTRKISSDKVSEPGEECHETIITPNQKILYSRKNEMIQKFLVDAPEILVSATTPPPIGNFQDAPVSEIFKNIEESYGIDIVYDKETFGDCLLTASFSQESLYDKIDLICKGVEAEFKVIDGRVIISGRGCH